MSNSELLLEKYAKIYGLKSDDITEAERKWLLEAAEEYASAKPTDVFLPLPRRNTALLVIDLQHDFVAPGARMWVPQNYRIVPKVKKLIHRCRELGIPVIFTEQVHHPSGIDKGIHWDLPVNRGVKEGACREGSPGSDVYGEIAPMPLEKVIRKHRYSAFYNTDLDTILRNLGVTHLIVCGCMTNYCCGSTVRDAYNRDYKVIFGSDINVTDNPDVHEAELMTLRRGFALVLSSDEILQQLNTMDTHA